MNKMIYDAIENMKIISFYYDDKHRVIEPHCYGVSTKGHEIIRGYQVEGKSSDGEFGWKLFSLSKIKDLEVHDIAFRSPQTGYKRGDKNMQQIFIEL